MENFLFCPDSAIDRQLSRYLEQAEAEFLSYEPTKPDWLTTEEGQIHNSILCNFVILDPTVTASSMSKMFAACMRRSAYSTGRPRIFKPGRTNGKYRRALRNYFLNKLIAQGLGLSYETPPPEYEEFSRMSEPNIVEKLEHLENFEKWTNYKLPHPAWVVFTREDRKVLAKHFDAEGWTEGQEPCLKLEKYIALRNDSKNLKTIRAALSAAKTVAISAPPIEEANYA